MQSSEENRGTPSPKEEDQTRGSFKFLGSHSEKKRKSTSRNPATIRALKEQDYCFVNRFLII